MTTTAELSSEAVAGLVERLRKAADYVADLDERTIIEETFIGMVRDAATRLSEQEAELAEAKEGYASCANDYPALVRQNIANVERLTQERDEQHDIVARIWKLLGSPTYEELAGRSIYDLIEGIQSENARLRRELDEANERLKHAQEQASYAETAQSDALDRADSLKAEVGKLRAALEPFARAVEKADERAKKGGFAPSFDEYTTEWSFTFGDLRRARQALGGVDE